MIDPCVAAILADSNMGRYWLAELDGKVVGQIMVTAEWNDRCNGRFRWIQCVNVHEDYRRKGVFPALYRHVESVARQDPEVCGPRQYLGKDSKRARETYH